MVMTAAIASSTVLMSAGAVGLNTAGSEIETGGANCAEQSSVGPNKKLVISIMQKTHRPILHMQRTICLVRSQMQRPGNAGQASGGSRFCVHMNVKGYDSINE